MKRTNKLKNKKSAKAEKVSEKKIQKLETKKRVTRILNKGEARREVPKPKGKTINE